MTAELEKINVRHSFCWLQLTSFLALVGNLYGSNISWWRKLVSISHPLQMIIYFVCFENYKIFLKHAGKQWNRARERERKKVRRIFFLLFFNGTFCFDVFSVAIKIVTAVSEHFAEWARTRVSAIKICCCWWCGGFSCLSLRFQVWFYISLPLARFLSFFIFVSYSSTFSFSKRNFISKRNISVAFCLQY